MAKTDPFYHFPVAMLRGAVSTESLIRDIILRTNWKVGYSLYLEDEEAINPIVAKYCYENDPPPGFIEGNLSHNIYLAGAIRVRSPIGSVKAEHYRAMQLSMNFMDKGTQVRIRGDILLSALNDKWPLLRFKTLCGVIGGIGNKPFAKLTNLMIRAIGAGYNSPSGVADECLLAKTTVQRAINDLWIKNLFQRVGSMKN